MTITIQKGRRYVTARGLVTSRMRQYDAGLFDVRSDEAHIGSILWRADGTVLSHMDDGHNLIREARDDEKTGTFVSVVASSPTADGWISWDGGRFPVPLDTKIKYRMRNGDVSEGEAGQLRWSHEGWPGDIVAYRVVAPEPYAFRAGDHVVSVSDTDPSIRIGGVYKVTRCEGNSVHLYDDNNDLRMRLAKDYRPASDDELRGQERFVAIANDLRVAKVVIQDLLPLAVEHLDKLMENERLSDDPDRCSSKLFQAAGVVAMAKYLLGKTDG